MKVLHFILGKANKDRANGVNQVIAGLAKYTARYGVDVRVIGKAGSVKKEGELIQRDGFTIQAFSQLGLQLSKAVDEAIVWADVVHLHGVFSPWNLWVAKKMQPVTKTLCCDTPQWFSTGSSNKHNHKNKKIAIPLATTTSTS